ncbi:HNH endonuclease [Enterococcus hirae]|uniref:HNH endonuclease n=1 Tax=Enterococcus hirae TaxID=1354 RepID=UPI002EB495DE|nr:HNH endonuclease [Enterococcus hirae]
MKLHGDIKLSRSVNLKEVKHYSEFKDDLRKDFQYRCGYCSKLEKLTTTGFEIDHFVPQHIDETKTKDYNNLVYSCFTCNRKKGGKWPTKDSSIHHDEFKGFIDPVSEELDQHLGRKESGEIEYYSELGKYLANDVFKFNIRPVKIIWKLGRLIESKKKLSNLIVEKQTCNPEEGLLLAKFCTEIDNLTNYIFEKRE